MMPGEYCDCWSVRNCTCRRDDDDEPMPMTWSVLTRTGAQVGPLSTQAEAYAVPDGVLVIGISDGWDDPPDDEPF